MGGWGVGGLTWCHHQLVLESMAEVQINFGMGDINKSLRKEVVRSCSKFAIGCMDLANVTERGVSSFGRFSRLTTNRGREGLPQYRAAMKELC